MKTSNAYKMIERSGSQLRPDPRYHRGLIAPFGYYNIELTDQDGAIIAIKVVPAHEAPDQVTDYYPGTYMPSLTRAIDYVIPRQIDGNPRPVEDLMAEKGTHGGPGRGQGRHPRQEPKSKGIWCGQITEEQRQLIIRTLTPEERLQALLRAAEAKQTT